MADVLTGTDLEIKARASDLNGARERARELGARRQGVERQEDAYFRVPDVAADRFERLMAALGIGSRDLIDGSYAEVT